MDQSRVKVDKSIWHKWVKHRLTHQNSVQTQEYYFFGFYKSLAPACQYLDFFQRSVLEYYKKWAILKLILEFLTNFF